MPTPLTAVALGLALTAAGFVVLLNRVKQWDVLGQICLVIGALMFSGGVIAFGEGSLSSMLIVTAVLALIAIAARSSLLAALAVLAASACLGASDRIFACDVFAGDLRADADHRAVLGARLAAYRVSKQVPADYERLALNAARTSILLVNFGFWIGSLWGDPLILLRAYGQRRRVQRRGFDDVIIPAWAFSVVWALALIAAAVWAVRVNRRWLVNVAAAFGAIHFYTQWFERLGATPVSVLLGGVVMLAIALALWTFNRRRRRPKGRRRGRCGRDG